MTTPTTPPPPTPGSVSWMDLTVPNADQVRDFYRAAVGWEPSPVNMAGYSDYVMKTPDGAAVAGVCHARGINADLPPQWLIYITVKDLDASIRAAEAHGGKIRVGPKNMGPNRYCVVEDPAGAVSIFYEARV